MIQFWLVQYMFQVGWFNHQLVIHGWVFHRDFRSRIPGKQTDFQPKNAQLCRLQISVAAV